MKDTIARAQIKALEALRVERDRRYTERFIGQEMANKLALEAAEKAVLKAENASERRFESVNEFRASLSDQAAQFVTRKEVEALLAGVNATLARLEKHDNLTAGRGVGISQLWGFIAGAAGLLVAVAAVVFK